MKLLFLESGEVNTSPVSIRVNTQLTIHTPDTSENHTVCLMAGKRVQKTQMAKK